MKRRTILGLSIAFMLSGCGRTGPSGHSDQSADINVQKSKLERTNADFVKPNSNLAGSLSSNASLKKEDASAQQKIAPLVEEIATGQVKADTIIITDGGMGVNKYGGFSASISQNGALSPQAKGSIKVYIFRNLDAFPNAQQLAIKAGAAYLNPSPGAFQFIREIDLGFTDEQLCRQFGLEIK
jgi:hypothetical protein